MSEDRISTIIFNPSFHLYVHYDMCKIVAEFKKSFRYFINMHTLYINLNAEKYLKEYIPRNTSKKNDTLYSSIQKIIMKRIILWKNRSANNFYQFPIIKYSSKNVIKKRYFINGLFINNYYRVLVNSVESCIFLS